MSIRSAVTSRAAAMLTGQARQQRHREKAERERHRQGAPHRIDVFIDVADPYSVLVAQMLPILSQRYDVVLQPWLVGPPDAAAAPEPALLNHWSLRDAAVLAQRAALDFPSAPKPPGPAAISAVQGRIAAAIEDGSALDVMPESLGALWHGTALPPGRSCDPATALAAGNRRRADCGHYLGAVFAYGGETYWGIDRLHYLETRLIALGAACDGATQPLLPPPPDIAGPVANPRGGAIDFFLSFRSPYTWLATERVGALAAAHGATVNLRFVLPMVMRSLPVPPSKRRYITLDAAREAQHQHIPFGRIADPVGRPVERGYSLLPWAREQGRGMEYCAAFMRAVWSQGVDAGSDTGLRKIVASAGLDWSDARTIVDNQDWRAEAEANRAEMIALGLWGVPSFRYGDTAVWGQDRLWVIDAALRAT